MNLTQAKELFALASKKASTPQAKTANASPAARPYHSPATCFFLLISGFIEQNLNNLNVTPSMSIGVIERGNL